MSVRFEIKVDDERVAGELARLHGRVLNLTPALDEIGAALVTSTQQRFEDEKGPDGQKWKALALSTYLRRAGSRRVVSIRGKRGAAARDGGPGSGNVSILRERGDLYDSIGHQVIPGGVRVGANRPYARIHQLGGQAGRGHRATIPARPYLGVSPDDAREISDIVGDYLNGGG